VIRPFALDIIAGDFAFAAGHRLLCLGRFQIWLRSRFTAMLAGLRTLIQARDGPVPSELVREGPRCAER
jgi:hypothetical protein